MNVGEQNGSVIMAVLLVAKNQKKQFQTTIFFQMQCNPDQAAPSDKGLHCLLLTPLIR